VSWIGNHWDNPHCVGSENMARVFFWQLYKMSSSHGSSAAPHSISELSITLVGVAATATAIAQLLALHHVVVLLVDWDLLLGYSLVVMYFFLSIPFKWLRIQHSGLLVFIVVKKILKYLRNTKGTCYRVIVYCTCTPDDFVLIY